MNAHGFKTGILDADITGPSIPKAFGLHGQPEAAENGMYPIKSRDGIDVMSINFLLPNESDPVIWRGPVISGAVKQFWTLARSAKPQRQSPETPRRKPIETGILAALSTESASLWPRFSET